MNNPTTYNGTSTKRSFHKLKKHLDILKKRLSYKQQKTEMEAIDNRLLNVVLQSVVSIKKNNYTEADKAIFKNIDSYRTTLLQDSSEISYAIFNSSAVKQVKEIYQTAASPKVWGQFLYLLTKYSKAGNILEIGTNVGISGSYFLNAMKQNTANFKLTTMEGLSQLCSLSEKQFLQIANKDNFEIISGLYDNTFPDLINKQMKFDLLFIDGNHQKAPTLHYFDQLKNCIKDPALFVFDDIYYNPEMTEAWEIIKSDASVNFSIDMYRSGIIIVDNTEAIKNKAFGMHLSYQ